MSTSSVKTRKRSKKKAQEEEQLDLTDPLALAERSRNDPEWWVKNVLGDHLWSKQAQVIEAVRDHDEVAVASCHAAGKSFTASRVALWYLYNHHPSIVITTAPTDRQVRKILWKEIKSAHAKSKIPLGGEALTQELRLTEDWFALGFTAPDQSSDKFQGFHSDHILIIVDEASGVSEEIFEGIDGILSNQAAKLLMISNPIVTAGRFSSSFQDPATESITISAFDTPNLKSNDITLEKIRDGSWRDNWDGKAEVAGLISPAWVAKQYRKRGEESPFFVSRVLGNFPEEGEDTLVPYSWVLRSQTNDQPHLLDDSDDDYGPVMGVDVARFGSDESIISMRTGYESKIVWAGEKRDTMYLVGKTLELARQFGVKRIIIDETGLGSGVVDRLKEVVHEDNLSVEIIGINFSQASNDPEKYLNKRAEMFWELREQLRNDEIKLPKDEQLASELSSIKYKYTSRGQIQIESKNDLKKRLKISPDRADSIVLCYATPTTSQLFVGATY